MVLGGGADHRRSSDVNLLDAVRERGRGVTGHGRAERVQVDDHHVDRADIVFFQRGHVLLLVAHRQDPGVHRGVQRLDAAVQHLGVARHLVDASHRAARRLDCAGTAAGRHHLESKVHQALGEVLDVGFIRHGEEGLALGSLGGTGGGGRPLGRRHRGDDATAAHDAGGARGGARTARRLQPGARAQEGAGGSGALGAGAARDAVAHGSDAAGSS
mmetsp:Transcript_41967/g.105275  ORF Transcript_41967/g.105275 Transcript_41967/m.105275 type:complete len:215 (+) Transcript_41967:1205-1849(+)